MAYCVHFFVYVYSENSRTRFEAVFELEPCASAQSCVTNDVRAYKRDSTTRYAVRGKRDTRLAVRVDTFSCRTRTGCRCGFSAIRRRRRLLPRCGNSYAKKKKKKNKILKLHSSERTFPGHVFPRRDTSAAPTPYVRHAGVRVFLSFRSLVWSCVLCTHAIRNAYRVSRYLGTATESSGKKFFLSRNGAVKTFLS